MTPRKGKKEEGRRRGKKGKSDGQTYRHGMINSYQIAIKRHPININTYKVRGRYEAREGQKKER